ncbi:MAG: hypothetical protein Q9182_001019 [Xanthomendoza sp. 2 TL-2023]
MRPGTFLETSRGLVVIPGMQQAMREHFPYVQEGTPSRVHSPFGNHHRSQHRKALFTPQLNVEAAELQRKVIRQQAQVSAMLPKPVYNWAHGIAEPALPKKSIFNAGIDRIVAYTQKQRIDEEVSKFEASMYRLENGVSPQVSRRQARTQKHDLLSPDIESGEYSSMSMSMSTSTSQHHNQRTPKREREESPQQPVKRRRPQYSMMSDRPSVNRAFYGGPYLERLHSGQQEQYIPLKTLGTGGQGTAHLLKTRRTGSLVVCKVIPHTQSDQKDKSELSFLRDALPRHPRIVNLRSALVSPFQTQLYLDYCSGGDLTSFIEAFHYHPEPHAPGQQARTSFNPIPESFIWHTYLQLTEALAFIHYGYNRNAASVSQMRPDKWLGVIHRDIKPGNILLQRAPSHPDHPGPEPYPKIVLADFGLAKKADEFNTPPTSNGWVGTFIWQAPEIPYHSVKGDVWSAGAIIFDMMAGYLPTDELPQDFDDVSAVGELWLKDLTAEKTNLIDGAGMLGYSTGLEWCLDRALTVNPDVRHGSLQLMWEIEDCRDRMRAVWEDVSWVWREQR